MNTHGTMLRIGCFVVALIITPALAQSDSTRRATDTRARMTPMRPVNQDRRPATRVAPNSRETRVAENRAPARRTRHRDNGKQEAEIDSLDVERRHDGCFWAVEIEYEVELEGIAEDEVFFLGLEVLEDGKPVLDGDGQPMTFVVELVTPTKDKKGKREYEDRARIRVHKDWVGDDDDLEIKATLVRDADGRIFDIEDEDADQDRPGPFLNIGAYGIGISIPL